MKIYNYLFILKSKTQNKISFYFVVSFFLIGCSKSVTTSNKPIDKMQWLIGTWKMQEKNGVSTEIWKRKNDSIYTAVSSMPNEIGKVVPFENIELIYENKRYFYFVTTANQNDAKPVRFEIAKITRNSFVAENLKHDFPRRITYKLITKNFIQAIIDDGLAKPMKVIYFNFYK